MSVDDSEFEGKKVVTEGVTGHHDNEKDSGSKDNEFENVSLNYSGSDDIAEQTSEDKFARRNTSVTSEKKSRANLTPLKVDLEGDSIGGIANSDTSSFSTASPSSFLNLFPTFAQKQNNDLDNIIEEGSAKTAQDLGASNKPTTPVIISHRRQVSGSVKRSAKRQNSISSNSSSVVSMVLEADKNAKSNKEDGVENIPTNNKMETSTIRKPSNAQEELFTSEKFLDTEFRYASEARNREFHDFFDSAPKDDKLLDSFTCTLSKDFLYQGKLYITGTRLCFNSNLLGWVSKIIIPFKEVIFMEKTSAAGLFPNAISIETTLGKTQFNGFASRDNAFDLMKEIWARVLIEEGEKKSSESFSEEDHALMKVEKIKSAAEKNYTSENLHNSDESTSNINQEKTTSTENGIENYSDKVRKLKENTNLSYKGPYHGCSVEIPSDMFASTEETLTEFDVETSPGVLFQLLFGDNNTNFWLDFANVSNDTFDYSQIPSFGNVDDEGHRFREYSYTKKLNYAVGPTSTKCLAHDTIYHLEYDRYINVVCTTRTPDIPNGNSFCTKTRYLFKWSGQKNCTLKISFWVEWTGSSWFKGMIESSCKSGLRETTNILKPFIYKYVNENTEWVINDQPEPLAVEQSHECPKPGIDEMEIRKQNDKILNNLTAIARSIKIFGTTIIFLLLVDIALHLEMTLPFKSTKFVIHSSF